MIFQLLAVHKTIAWITFATEKSLNLVIMKPYQKLQQSISYFHTISTIMYLYFDQQSKHGDADASSTYCKFVCFSLSMWWIWEVL